MDGTTSGAVFSAPFCWPDEPVEAGWAAAGGWDVAVVFVAGALLAAMLAACSSR